MHKLSLENIGTYTVRKGCLAHREPGKGVAVAIVTIFLWCDQHYPLHFGAWGLAKVWSQVRLLARSWCSTSLMARLSQLARTNATLKLSPEYIRTYQCERAPSHTESLARALRSPLLQFSSCDQHYPLHFGAWCLAKAWSQVRILAEAGAAQV